MDLIGDPVSNIVERSESGFTYNGAANDNLSYKVSEGEDGEDGENGEAYEFSIPYDKAIEDFTGVASPVCGDEIDQLDVSKMKKPHQIRLSYTGDPTEMAITWTTNGRTEHELVNYGPVKSDLNYTSTSISHQYKWHWDAELSEWYYTSGFIHEALMINLIPGMIHYYQIESNGEESAVIKFVAAPDPGSNTPVSFMHVGDVGTFGTSVKVTNDMMKRMEEQQFHGLIHCGDISYANKFNHSRPKNAEQKVWDTWGQMVEPVGSKMAYMAVPGNHELDIYDSTNENGTIYTKRFIMPGNERYFSFGVGMVHFVAVSTDESIDASSTQGEWFKNVLKKVNQNRKQWPWLVVFQHRPIYNSNKNHGNWTGTNAYENPDGYKPYHLGWPDHFEDLILENKVDLVLAGHVHHYERSWPVRDRNDTVQSYNKVDRPIHITCGHGGKGLYRVVWDTNDTNTYDEVPPMFSAARDNNNWGHCELDFIDAKTAKHRMYRMGSDIPTENITITRSVGVRVFVSLAVLLANFIILLT
ncbi:uncharacterized protein LOC134812966 isoform X3 [Bolinopsis microptera]|uniref:uncharacterized protein LOC134812966 isoform X3 n=1 Tax=Bolinopsis microptera TaxID=2820187 RepID=UPI00307AB5F3